MGPLDVFSNVLLQALDSVRTQDKPKLERSESSAQRYAPVAKVYDLWIIYCFEVFRIAAKGAQQGVDISDVIGRAVEVGEEPFVWVEDKAVGGFDAVEYVAHFGKYRGGTSVGCVHVKPQVVLLA